MEVGPGDLGAVTNKAANEKATAIVLDCDRSAGVSPAPGSGS